MNQLLPQVIGDNYCVFGC